MKCALCNKPVNFHNALEMPNKKIVCRNCLLQLKTVKATDPSRDEIDTALENISKIVS